MASAAAANPTRLSQAALARLLGVSRQGIADLVKRNIIPMAADGLIDVELARIAIAERVRPSGKINTLQADADPPPAPPPAEAPVDGPDAQLSYHVAKTLREAAEAKIAQLRLRKMQQQLTEVDKVEAAIFSASRMLRDMVLNVPKRVAADAVATGDARAAERMMTEALRRAFDDFRQLAMSKVESIAADPAATAQEPAP